MQTLAVSGGDLVLGSGGLQMISGSAKIRQDLALLLGESYGTDPYNPEWGSVLPQYIGTAMGSEIESLVESEVNRVLQQYIANQQAMLNDDAVNGRATTLTTSDIVQTVDDVSVVVSYDTIRVAISLTTMAGRTLSISRTVTT